MRPIDPTSHTAALTRDTALLPSDATLTALTAVAEAVSRMRFGAVHLTVHDGRVVQLDVTERQRFT